MNVQHFTYGQVLTSMCKAVTSKSEGYIFEGECFNLLDGEPACIVGHVLADLLGVDKVPVGGTIYGVAEQLKESKIATFDARAYILMDVAQNLQDDRVPWGDAFRAAQAAAGALVRAQGGGYITIND